MAGRALLTAMLMMILLSIFTGSNCALVRSAYKWCAVDEVRARSASRLLWFHVGILCAYLSVCCVFM